MTTYDNGPHTNEWSSQGEVPPMDAATAMNRKVDEIIANVTRDIFTDREHVIRAAKEWRRIEMTGGDVDSGRWVEALQKLRDAVDRMPVVFDLPERAL